MKAVTKLRALTKLSLSSILLICINTAVAQTSYRVTDLGALRDGVFGCAMELNNKGWTESMDGVLDESGNFVGRAVMRSRW
jgi:hypothetical protein